MQKTSLAWYTKSAHTLLSKILNFSLLSPGLSGTIETSLSMMRMVYHPCKSGKWLKTLLRISRKPSWWTFPLSSLFRGAR